MISAEVICDSISEQGKRLTTFKLRYPKFIHSEFMTHRVISRNASSSRAIPTAKLIEEVHSDALRATPVFWGKNQRGMQAAEELSSDKTLTNNADPFGPKISPKQRAEWLWSTAAFWAAKTAETMTEYGVHKQIVNRLLEPFSHINVVATATEWDNFFGLRLHRDAQPEMRALAIVMWEARKASEPELLKLGVWHLPFVSKGEDSDKLASDDGQEFDAQTLIKVSVARCARVSYESFETGKRSTVEEDLKLYDRLLSAQPLHASPAEHQATPDEDLAFNYGDEDYRSGWQHKNEWGNFVGWRQYRKMLPGEACAPIPEEFR
jgi:thymidylate synthase ThyX